MIPLPPAPATLDEMLATVARRHATRNAIVTMDASVTYAQLRDLVASLAAHMHQRGIGRGACVALNTEHPLLGIALTLACARVGAAWAPATQQVGASTAITITHLLYDGPPRPNPPDNYHHVTPDWSRPPPGPAFAATGYGSPSDPWMITQSSGTTGTPKLMAISEVFFCQRISPAASPLTSAGGVCAVPFPPLSLSGITRALSVLGGGGTAVMAQLTDIVGHIRLDCAIAAPNHYRRLLEQPPPARRTGIAIIGAGPATKALVTGLMRYFESVSVAYASTEAWIVCTKDYPATGPVPDVLPVGRPLPHVDLRIVDASGQDVPQGQQGIVRVRHPAQVAGYIGDPALTAEVFRDGWFQPGDLGYLNPDGELVVTGRIGEQLNVGGEKIAPAVIDEAILSVPGIRDAASFARPDAHGVDRLEAAIVVGGPDSSSATLSPATLSALAKHLRSRFEFIPERVYVLAEIPRTATGKVPRHQLPAAVAGAKAYSL